jgi:predicted O-methyltransferase YrrM
MGCTAIHRKVFESWNPKKMPWFKTPEGTKGAMGHDVHFCTEAKRLGFPIHVDTKVVAGHQGLWTSTLETYLATRTYNSNIWQDWNPVQIQTAMTQAERDKLAELAQGGRVLEIGAWAGASTVTMGRTAEIVYSVDWHRQDKWHEVVGSIGDTLAGFRATVAFNGLQDKVVPLVGRSQDILPTMAPAQFDLIFIDGDHSYEGFSFDLAEARRLLKPGGFIACHDYKREELMPEYKDGEYALGVTKVIDELESPFEQVDSLVVLRPEASGTVQLAGTGE